MFSGTYIHSLDTKNRLIIPSKVREKIDTSRDGNGFVITWWFDECLSLYTPREWDGVLGKLQNIPFTDRRGRDVVRGLLAKSHEVPCDGHWRILLPEMLREAAHIKKEVAILGVIDHLEIWDLRIWQTRESDIANNLDTLAEGLL